MNNIKQKNESKNLKLLHVTSSYYPAFSFGGSVSADYETDNELSKSNIDIDISTTNAGLKKNEVKLNTWIKHKKINIIYFPFLGYIHYNFSLKYLFFLIKNIKNYDLIHFSGTWNFPIIFGPIIARIFNKPYIVTPHGTLYKGTFDGKSAIIKKIHYKLFVKKNLQKASAIHFTTKDEKEKVENFLKINMKSKVIPYGIDFVDKELNLEMYKRKYNIPNNKKIILFLGRINWIKGLDILIQGFSKILEKRDDCLLLCVGPDDENYSSELKKYIVNKNIIFTGMVSGDDKIAMYKMGNIFILPSYSENFGMTVIEAANFNLPIIISNKVGLHNEISENNAGIVIDTTIDAIINSIIMLLDDEKLSKTISSNALKMVNEKFTREESGKQFIEMYKEIINETRYISSNTNL